MKTIHILAAVGGVVALVHFSKKKAAVVAATDPRFPNLQLITSGRLSQKTGEEILNDPDQLEGYFSTGYFSTGDACCSNCASGKRCSG